MSEDVRGVEKRIDRIQQRLTAYASNLSYGDLSAGAIHAAKVRIIDTLGALIAGFFDDPCRIARNVAVQIPASQGATVIGTRLKTTPDMAAYVNATTARCAELTDTYHQPGSSWGHPSDVLMPIFAAAEHAQASGRDLITGMVLGYEVFCRVSDVFHNLGFDQTNFACLGSAVVAGKLYGLSAEQLSHCISIAVVPNVILKQVRAGNYKSMFKAVASGQAGRAGVFAAIAARSGMEGAHLPFEGKAGWCRHVARHPFSLSALGGDGTSFKIQETLIKNRPCAGGTISSVLAAEKLAPLSIKDVKQVIVEVYGAAKADVGTGEQRWNPDSREAADHSIPYTVAVTLMDGTVTLRSFNDAHLWNPDVRALMQKIEVVENEQFTLSFKRLPVEHRTRITVVTGSGERLVGESGGDIDDLAAPKSDAQIAAKFRGLTEDVLSRQQIDAVLDRLWHLHDVRSIAEIPPRLVLG